MSRSSVKYRLLEAGFLNFISSFEDYGDVYAEINGKREFVKLTLSEAYQLLSQDASLKRWISGGGFLFVDGYFVVADKKFIASSNGELHLTDTAKKNLSGCAINILEQKNKIYRNIQKDFAGYTSLYKVDGVDQRILTFHPKYQANFPYTPDEAYDSCYEQIMDYDVDEEKELMKLIGDPSMSLCQCLWYLMENRNWRYPEKFSESTWLHKNYYGKIRNNSYNEMGTNILMAICVGLRLNLRITEKIFEKSKNKLDYYNDPDKTYIRIMESLPGLSIEGFNSIVEKANIQQLGSKIQGED